MYKSVIWVLYYAETSILFIVTGLKETIWIAYLIAQFWRHKGHCKSRVVCPSVRPVHWYESPWELHSLSIADTTEISLKPKSAAFHLSSVSLRPQHFQLYPVYTVWLSRQRPAGNRSQLYGCWPRFPANFSEAGCMGCIAKLRCCFGALFTFGGRRYYFSMYNAVSLK